MNKLLITLRLTLKQLRFLCLIALGAISAILFSSCGTTSSRALPAYEPPIAKSDFQTVHTTAYTHTESDHLQFTNHNALGGELQAAGPPIHRAENTRSPIELDYRVATYTPAPQPFLMSDEETKSKRAVRKATAVTTTTDCHDADSEDRPWQARRGKGQTAAAEDRERSRRLVALASRHDFPITFDRTDLSGGRLRLGAGRTQHH